MTRAPKVGEVWTYYDAPRTCVVAEPDTYGVCIWRSFQGEYILAEPSRYIPPREPLPESWINVYRRALVPYSSRSAADAGSALGRLGLIHLLPDGTVEFIDLRDGAK